METVLIVDDDKISREIVKNFFSKESYRIVEADSGKSALESIEKSTPDIILLDVSMSDQSGFEICRKIKSIQKFETIPIIFITVADSIEDKAKGFDAGGNDYITKPINAREVKIRVRAHLRIKQAETERIQLVAATATAAAEKKRAEELKKAYAQLKESQAQLIQSEKLSSVGQLTAGVAHELNTPLAGLLGLLRIYKKTAKEGTRERKDLTLMLEASEHMAKTVKDLTSFARQSKGEFTSLDINEVLESTLGFSSGQLTTKNIKITKEYADNPLKINGDRSQLQQVVLNMITNARDAMPDGGEFTIRTRDSEDGDKVIIEFSDTGIGIKEGDLPRIFDPFFTTKKAGEGVGIGLSVTYGIIKSHNGNISVDSLLGKGARFTITLPGLKVKERNTEDGKG